VTALLPHDLGLWLRIGVVFLLAAVVAAALAVIRMHIRAWRAAPAKAGLTPLHVALVSAGVVVWGATLAWAVLDGLGQATDRELAVRIGLYGLGAVLILVSLLVMARVQRRRVRFCRTQTEAVLTVTTTDAVEVTGDVDDLSPGSGRCPYPLTPEEN
jgi:tellurite resistance protein TehA-like permease